MHLREAPQAHGLAANLALHPSKLAGRAEPSGGFEDGIEQREKLERKVIHGQQPPPGIGLGARWRGLGEDRLQPPLELGEQFPVPKLNFGETEFGK